MRPILRRSLWTLGGLAALLVAFHTVENFRGKRAWERWKAERRAAGAAFDLSTFAPPVVPEAENFAAHPAVAASLGDPGVPLAPPLPKAVLDEQRFGDWQQGVRADLGSLDTALEGQTLSSLLAAYEQPLKDLAEAAQRPQCRLVQEYGVTENLPIPALLGWRNGARVLRLRSLVALREGRSEDALRDVLLGLRVAQHLQKEPHLISQLLRIAWTNMILQPIWEGLQDQRWSPEQLVRLQAGLEPLDLVASYRQSLRFERVGSQISHEAILASTWLPERHLAAGNGPRWTWVFPSLVVPKGWRYEGLASSERLALKLFDKPLDEARHWVGVTVHKNAIGEWTDFMTSWRGRMQVAYLPALLGQTDRMARVQVGLDHARLACGLERHRLAQGSYPESLEALVPAHLPNVRPGLLEGLPDRYARTATGYRLHSVGWNLTDDGGAYPEASVERLARLEQGDWVWSVGDQK